MDNEVIFLFVVFMILAVVVGVIIGGLYTQENLGEVPADSHGSDDGHGEETNHDTENESAIDGGGLEEVGAER